MLSRCKSVSECVYVSAWGYFTSLYFRNSTFVESLAFLNFLHT